MRRAARGPFLMAMGQQKRLPTYKRMDSMSVPLGMFMGMLLQEYHAGESGIAAFLLPNAILLPNAKTDH